jgi:hypothetical protein
MIRTRVKGTAIKPSSSPDSEPNFYEMEYCGAPVDSFFDFSPSVNDKERDEESTRRDGTPSRKHVVTPFKACGRKKRVSRRLPRRVSIDLDNRNDWTANTTVSPGIEDTASHELIAPSFIEMTKSIDLAMDDAIGESEEGSVMNWIQSHLSGEVLGSGAERVSFVEHDHVAGVPIASISADDSDVPLDSLDLPTECTMLKSEEPRTGDVEFFEGQPFYYLQHISFDSLHSIMDDTEAFSPLQSIDDNFTIENLDPSLFGL